MSVEWVPIPGWEGYYEISAGGAIRSVARTTVSSAGHRYRVRERLLKPWLATRGYLTVSLTRDSKMTTRPVHRLMAEAFLPNPGGLPVVRHLDDDKLNNALSNLAWGTQTDNLNDSVRNGTHHDAKKTHCIRGHEFTAENTYSPPSRPKMRNCKTCRRAYAAKKSRERKILTNGEA